MKRYSLKLVEGPIPAESVSQVDYFFAPPETEDGECSEFQIPRGRIYKLHRVENLGEQIKDFDKSVGQMIKTVEELEKRSKNLLRKFS